MSYTTQSEKETRQIGRLLAKHSQAGDIICLIGDLGAGKTTFVKGLAEGLNYDPLEVSSPTFVLMNIYEGRLPVFHFDLYRLGEGQDVSRLGLDEFLYGDGVAVIEWAERLGAERPDKYLLINLEHIDNGQRALKLTPYGKRYEDLIERMKESWPI